MKLLDAMKGLCLTSNGSNLTYNPCDSRLSAQNFTLKSHVHNNVHYYLLLGPGGRVTAGHNTTLTPFGAPIADDQRFSMWLTWE